MADCWGRYPVADLPGKSKILRKAKPMEIDLVRLLPPSDPKKANSSERKMCLPCERFTKFLVTLYESKRQKRTFVSNKSHKFCHTDSFSVFSDEHVFKKRPYPHTPAPTVVPRSLTARQINAKPTRQETQPLNISGNETKDAF